MEKFLRIAELKDFRLPDGRYGFGRIYASRLIAKPSGGLCAVWELNHVIDRLMGDDK